MPRYDNTIWHSLRIEVPVSTGPRTLICYRGGKVKLTSKLPADLRLLFGYVSQLLGDNCPPGLWKPMLPVSPENKKRRRGDQQSKVAAEQDRPVKGVK